MTDRVLPVNIPSVAFKGSDDTDAWAFERAAKNLETGYPMGGGNLTAAVARLLRNAAAALKESGQPDPEESYYTYQRTR